MLATIGFHGPAGSVRYSSATFPALALAFQVRACTVFQFHSSPPLGVATSTEMVSIAAAVIGTLRGLWPLLTITTVSGQLPMPGGVKVTPTVSELPGAR